MQREKGGDDKQRKIREERDIKKRKGISESIRKSAKTVRTIEN